MVSAMNGFIAGTVFIWPAGGNGGIQPPAVVVRLGAGGCAPPDVGLRLTPWKALFFRRGAQTFHREKPPAAVWVCAPYPGKPYSFVEGRKPIAGKRRRRPCEFAPHTPESLISPLRGANQLPGRGAGGRESLRLIPGKALFFR